MGSLRDICLQVRYDGNVKVMVEGFFAPASLVATTHKARVRTLTKQTLLPIALTLSDAVASKAKLQLIIESDLKSAPSCGTEILPTNEELQQELLRLLSEISSIPQGNQVFPSDNFEIVVCTFNSQDKTPCKSVSEVTGFFIDETGAAVSYVADWNEELAPAVSERSISIAWSWGDPKFRVRSEIAEFDELWSNNSTGVVSFVANDELKQHFYAVLLTLAASQDFGSSCKESIRLFPHQEKAVSAWMERTFHGVFKMCTGAGKTISALAAVKALEEKRAEASLSRPPVIVTVPTRVLADQWIREIKRFGFQSVLAAYNSFDQWNNILEPMLRDKNAEQSRFIVTTYRTFADERFIAKLQRMSGFGVEALWIADEMHNLASTKLRDAMRKVEKLFKFRLGLSATPDVEGDMAARDYLLTYFGNICASYELADGIKDGVLCKYRYYPIPAYLSPSIGKKYLTLLQEINDDSGGSTTLVNLYRETRDLLRRSGVQIARFRDVLNDLIVSVPDLKHTLIYCPPGYGTYGGENSDEIDKDEDERRLIEDVIEILRTKNLSPASILGETVADQRTQILERFADGRVRALCAIGCLDEGVDVPAIKRAIVLYSVDREKQFVQRRGRILRQPRGIRDKIAEIFDIVILPQGADMPRAQAETLLNREMRRYREFARLAENRQEADESISKALSVATNTGSTTIIPPA